LEKAALLWWALSLATPLTERKTVLQEKLVPTINFDFFDLITWIPSWYERETCFVDVTPALKKGRKNLTFAYPVGVVLCHALALN